MPAARRLRRAVALATFAVALIPAAGPAGAAPAAERFSTAAWGELVRYLPDLVRIAALDPATAAALVPATWLDGLLDASLALAAEEASVPRRRDPPHRGPVGPWPSPQALAHSLEATDPAAAAALLRALEPRIAQRCRARRLEPAAAERALRASAARLADRAVVERAAGGEPAPLTPTQRELARLGVPVVLVVRERIQALADRLWSAPASRADAD